MFARNAIAIFAFASLALTQDVDYDDLPSQCTAVCDPIVRLTQRCDDGKSGADQLQCVCGAMNATVQLPACEACFAMYDSDGHDNDVHDLLTKCSFTTTSYVPSATNSNKQTPSATSEGSGAPATTGPSSTTPSGTGSAGDQTPSMTSNTESPAENTGAAAAIGVDGMLGMLVGAAGVVGYF